MALYMSLGKAEPLSVSQGIKEAPCKLLLLLLFWFKPRVHLAYAHFNCAVILQTHLGVK